MQSAKSISQWRREVTARLKPVAGELAAFESYRMLGHLCGCGPTELTLRSADILDPGTETKLEAFIQERLTGRPLAYVLGRAYFHGIELICDSRAMIPRPESEEMLELALERLPDPSEGVHPIVVDVGTGSGNLALAVANARPDTRVIATDIEAPALELAGENCALLGLTDRVTLVSGRSLSMFRPDRSFDMIISNPPYIAVGDPYVEKSVVEHEPHTALFAGPDGLEIVRELLEQAEDLLRPGGWFLCEIGYDQGPVIRALTHSHRAWEEPALHVDMSGIERVLMIRRRS